MPSELEIANAALVRVGDAPLQHWNEESPGGAAVRALWSSVVASGLGSHPWSWAEEVRELAYLEPQPKSHLAKCGMTAWGFPANTLVLRAITLAHERRLAWWELEHKAVWLPIGVDGPQPYAIVTAPVEPERWSPLFVAWAEVELASRLAVALREDRELAHMLYQQSVLALMRAKHADAMSKPTPSIGRRSTLRAARRW